VPVQSPDAYDKATVFLFRLNFFFAPVWPWVDYAALARAGAELDMRYIAPQYK